MVDIYRARAVWSGFPGGPGTSTYYSLAIPDTVAFRAYYDTLKGIYPPAVSIQVQSTGDIINEEDGELTGSWSAGAAPAPVVGTGAGVYAAPVGVLNRFTTSTIVAGRRVKGRLFHVPAVTSAFQTDGSVAPTIVASVATAGSALIAGHEGQMVVWARPKEPTEDDPGRLGSHGIVTGSVCPDMAVTLRTRRD
jgi:hypothetical protein